MELIVSLSDLARLQDLAAADIKNIIVTSKEFGDRANRFFTIDEVEKLIEKAKEYGIRVYLNVNAMVHEFELDSLRDYLSKIAELDLEGIYFNDLSVLSLAKKYQIRDKLIFNPDTLMTNTPDIQAYLDYGIKSVVISKEISLDEAKQIVDGIPGRLQMIVHGRLNMSYSRRIFIRNYMDHIDNDYDYRASADLTLIEATREHKMPIMENEHGTSIFTDYTLCSFAEIGELSNLDMAIVDDVFLDFEEIEYALSLYNRVLGGEDGSELLAAIQDRYPESDYDSGYMYRKTNLVK